MQSIRLFFALVALLGGGLMSTPAADAELPAPQPAPLRVTLPGGRLTVVTTPPNLAAANPLADPAFAQATPLGPLYANGQPESAQRATTCRLVRCGDTLYLAAECRLTRLPRPFTGEDVTELWKGDALEIFLTGTPPAGMLPPPATSTPPPVKPAPVDLNTPYTQIVIAADGRAVAWRFGSTRLGVDDAATDHISTAKLTVVTGVGADGHGWWVCVAIPADPFAPDLAGLRGNLVRDNAGAASSSWCDMDYGSAHQPERFAPLAPPTALADGVNLPMPVPELQLPAALAVGTNHLKVLNPAKGYVLVCGETTVALDRETIDLPMVGSGRRALNIRHPGDDPQKNLRSYELYLRRPIFLEAVQPFADALDQPIDCRLNLNIAVDQAIPVILEARQNGQAIGSLNITAGAGQRTVAIPIAGAQAGEISLHAVAVVPVPGPGDAAETVKLVAEHLCVRGRTRDELDRFRDGLDQLDLRQRYRAMLCDAAVIFRLIQAGDGRVRSISRRGGFEFVEWNYGAAHIFAMAYTADWPENPHRGDKRFLTAALQALEAGLDPEAPMPAGGHSRHLRPLVLTYELIEKDLDPATRAHCREQVTELADEVVRTRLMPASRRYTLYSHDLGTGTNHFAYYCTGVLAAGRVLGRADWTALATEFLTRLADHGRDGQFPERPGVSASHYTWLTMHALGQFYQDTQNPDLLPVLKNCAAYAVHTSLPLPKRGPYLLHDGRNNTYGGMDSGLFVVSLTPAGRKLVATQQAERLQPGQRPSDADPQFWYRTADDAVYCQTGATADLPDPSEFTFLGGRALVARRNGFAYGLSAISLAPISGAFRLDPQNAVELHSLSQGPLLHGANSQDQPEAGSFLRTVAGRTEYLPMEGTHAKLLDGHATLLYFPSFKARLAVTVRDARHARVSVQILSRTGPEPVVFNFFPGVIRADELTASEDGKTLRFGKIQIQCSAAPKLDRVFKIFNPYNWKQYTIHTKPVRASIELADSTPFILEIEQP